MKKPIKLILFLFAFSTFFANMVYGQNDSGGVILWHPGPHSTVLIKDGKFATQLTGGDYNFTMLYSEFEKDLSSKNTKISDVEISLVLYSKSLNGKDNVPTKTVVNKETGALTLTVPPGGAIISGTIAYALLESNTPNNTNGSSKSAKPKPKPPTPPTSPPMVILRPIIK